MTLHVSRLKTALDNVPVAPASGANFIWMGDLNTMGMDLSYSDKDMDGAEELERYKQRLARKGMRYLSKTHPHTWWGGTQSQYPRSDLDHAFASESIELETFDGALIDVRGWPELPTAAQQDE